MVKLKLYNGSRTKEAWNADSPEFIDDWKPEEREFVVKTVQITYGFHLKAYPEGPDGDVMEMYWDEEGFLHHDECFFGDMEVTCL